MDANVKKKAKIVHINAHCLSAQTKGHVLFLVCMYEPEEDEEGSAQWYIVNEPGAGLAYSFLKGIETESFNTSEEAIKRAFKHLSNFITCIT